MRLVCEAHPLIPHWKNAFLSLFPFFIFAFVFRGGILLCSKRKTLRFSQHEVRETPHTGKGVRLIYGFSLLAPTLSSLFLSFFFSASDVGLWCWHRKRQERKKKCSLSLFLSLVASHSYAKKKKVKYGFEISGGCVSHLSFTLNLSLIFRIFSIRWNYVFALMAEMRTAEKKNISSR